MNKAQKIAVLEVIASDCTATNVLCEQLSDKQCIQGGLAVAAGVPIDNLRGQATLSPAQYILIRKVFGLKRHQLDFMMTINDFQPDIFLRRSTLSQYISHLGASDE